jgi:hypothetical protein
VRPRTAITTEHLRRAVLAELAGVGEASSLELARRLLDSVEAVDVSRVGQAASGVAARGLAIRTAAGTWLITEAGQREVLASTGRAIPAIHSIDGSSKGATPAGFADSRANDLQQGRSRETSGSTSTRSRNLASQTASKPNARGAP